MKKLLKYLLGFTAAAVLTATGAGEVLAAAPTYGNCSENILNGGVLAEADGHLFYANTDAANRLYADSQMISSDAAENINVIGQDVYYTTDEGAGSVVYRVSRTGGRKQEILATSKTIDEMYVDSEGTILYLAGGSIYERGSDAEKSTVIAQGSITHFIPTSHGVIAAKGHHGSYTIFADGQTIQSGVDSFYTYEDYLLFSRDGKDYQVRIHDLFDGFTAASIETYDLGDSTDAVKAFADNLEEDDVCPECEANMKTGTPTLASEKDDIDAVTAGVTSALHSGMVSEGQYNIVLRARQQHEVEWTPKKDILPWGNNSDKTFKAGTTYSGLPYGQPAGTNSYVPWSYSLVDFVNAVNDTSSKMYTSRSTYNRSAPYYSCDCSSFVSWSWDLPSREYTGSIAYRATEITTKSIYSLQVGDAFNKSGSHVVLVSDIGYRGDEIVYIDIMEQTPPSTKYTRWGEGGTKKLSDFYSKYWGNGYKLIRSKTRDSAEYTPSAAVQLDGEVAPSLANSGVVFKEATVNLATGATSVLEYTSTVSGTVTWESSCKSVASVSADGKVTAKKAGMTVISLYVDSILRARSNVYVSPARTVLGSVKSSSANTATISWTAVPSAAKHLEYVIYRKKADGSWEERGTATGTSFTDKNLASYSSYTYTVQAVATTKNGTVLKGGYDPAGKTVRTMMDTPVLKELTPKTVTSMKLTWLPVNGAKTYKVYRRENKKWKAVASTSGTTYTGKKLTKGAKYTYTVRAFNDSGKSNYNHKGLTTRMTAPTPVLKNLQINDYGKATLTWKRVKGASGYKVYRKIGKKSFKYIATVKSTKYVDTTLKYGKTYSYTVRAITRNGGSEILSGYDKTGLTCTMKLDAPELVSAVSLSAGTLSLQWEAVAGADAYVIYRQQPNGKWGKPIAKVKKNHLSFTDKNLVSGSSHRYTVRAAWKVGKKYYQGFFDRNGVSGTVQ